MRLLTMASLTLVTILATSFPAAAQPAERDSFADGSLSWSTWTEHGRTADGWTASLALYPSRRVGVVWDFGHYQGLPLDFHMGGVRIRFPHHRLSPFMQVLVGRAPLDDFAFQPGGGVDLHFHRHLAARVAADVKMSGDDGSAYYALRFSAGLVVSIGR
jgi:hypothetical protein